MSPQPPYRLIDCGGERPTPTAGPGTQSQGPPSSRSAASPTPPPRLHGGTPLHGTLTEIPGSGTYARAEEAGFTAVPLATVEQLLPR